jgi:hypothetical protein
VEFGNEVSFTYVMAGLARELDPGYADVRAGPRLAPVHEAMLLDWLDCAARSRMPIDPRLWSEGPIRSTYPACMAVKAAAEQGTEAAERCLRALREGLLCFRRRLDSVEALAEMARDAGLDVRRFRIDLDSNAIVEAFGADLEATRATAAAESLSPPLLGFDGDGEGSVLSAVEPYEEWRRAALAAGARPTGEERPDVPAALRRFGRLATPEVAAACDLPELRAEAELWRLAAEGRLRPVRVLTGGLWELE